MKLQAARAVLGEHPVDDAGVTVDVQIERRPKPLDDRHRAAPAVRDVLLRAGPPPEKAEHRPDEHAEHRSTQRVIPRDDVPQSRRQREDPLTDGHGRKTWSTRCAARSAIRRPPQLGQTALP
jgi:hypothetical protein